MCEIRLDVVEYIQGFKGYIRSKKVFKICFIKGDSKGIFLFLNFGIGWGERGKEFFLRYV